MVEKDTNVGMTMAMMLTTMMTIQSKGKSENWLKNLTKRE